MVFLKNNIFQGWGGGGGANGSFWAQKWFDFITPDSL